MKLFERFNPALCAISLKMSKVPRQLLKCLIMCSLAPIHFLAQDSLKLERLTVSSDDLSGHLIELLASEEKCSYFDAQTLFILQLRHIHNDSILLIEIQPSNSLKLAADLDPTGYFHIKDRLCFVTGTLEKSLFIRSDELASFPIHMEKVEPNPNEIVTTIEVTDDSYGIWFYTFSNGKLNLQKRVGPCH